MKLRFSNKAQGVRNDHKKLYFFIIAVLVGLITTLQIRSNFTYNGIVTIPKLIQMQKDIDNLKSETKQLKDSTAELSNKLVEYEASLANTGTIYGKMNSELLYTKDIAGLQAVEGPGVVITLSDGLEKITNQMFLDWIVVHDNDVLEIVNALKAAGAEAISINGERIMSTSSIRCGGPTILIDEKRHAIPFVIRAIGDPRKLEAIANSTNSYFDFLRYRGVMAQIHKVENMTIRGYNGKRKLMYQKKINGGDK